MKKEREKKKAFKKFAQGAFIGIVSTSLTWNSPSVQEGHLFTQNSPHTLPSTTIPNIASDGLILKEGIKMNVPLPFTVPIPQIAKDEKDSIVTAQNFPALPIEETLPPQFPDIPEAPPDEVWDMVAFCESRGNWAIIDASSTYYGGLQFDLSTWASVGGEGFPSDASREEQIYRAKLLWKSRGLSPWPTCGR